MWENSQMKWGFTKIKGETLLGVDLKTIFYALPLFLKSPESSFGLLLIPERQILNDMIF